MTFKQFLVLLKFVNTVLKTNSHHGDTENTDKHGKITL
jgi:hypothetical protein